MLIKSQNELKIIELQKELDQAKYCMPLRQVQDGQEVDELEAAKEKIAELKGDFEEQERKRQKLIQDYDSCFVA